MKFEALFGLLAPMSVLFCAAAQAESSRVALETSKGRIVIKLFAEKAPVSAENFLQYVKDGYYDGTVFHRVIPGFMIQGGEFLPALKPKGRTRAPIKNEADNGLKNKRGTLAMARTQERDSATSQFFINLVDNDFLDHGKRDFGYAVFGEVTEGMDVVDQIARVRTRTGGMYENVPSEPVLINKASIIPNE